MTAEERKDMEEFAKDIIDICINNGVSFRFRFYKNGDNLVKKIGNILGEIGNVSHGRTRLTFTFSERDWIIKIPFYGFEKYCWKECKIWKKAEEEKLDFAFAESHFLMEYRKIPIFIMKKCTPNVDRFNDHIETYLIENGWKFAENYSFNDGGLWSYLEMNLHKNGMTEGYIGLILDFFYRMEINDINSENVGLDENGNLLFIDYAGFNTKRRRS